MTLVFEDDIKFTDYAPALLRDALTPANFAACGLTRDAESVPRIELGEDGRAHVFRGIPVHPPRA